MSVVGSSAWTNVLVNSSDADDSTASSGTLSTTRLSSGSFFVCSITTDAPPPTAAKAPTPNAPYRKWRRVSRTSPPFGVGTRTPLPPALPLEVPRGAGDDGEGDAEDERRCAPTEPMALALPSPATLPTSAEPPRRPLPPCAPPYPATFPTCPPRAFGFPPAYSAPPREAARLFARRFLATVGFA